MKKKLIGALLKGILVAFLFLAQICLLGSLLYQDNILLSFLFFVSMLHGIKLYVRE